MRLADGRCLSRPALLGLQSLPCVTAGNVNRISRDGCARVHRLGRSKSQGPVDGRCNCTDIAHGLRSERGADAGAWSLRLRSAHLHETDQPFFEPGLFMITGDGLIHTLDVSHSPFVRPDLCGALNGITFIRKNNYPIRGTHNPS